MKTNLLVFATLLVCLPAVSQTGVNLKLNPEKNKVYRFSLVSEQTMTQTVNGNPQTVESKSNYSASVKMLDVTPDFMITEVHIDTLITKTNTMGKTTNLSSLIEGNIKSSEMADVISCIMNRLSKNALYVKLDFKGKVIEIVNSKMLADIIMQDTSSITLTGPTAAAIKSQIKNLVSDNSLKNMVEMFTAFVPGRQVSTGDTWNEIRETVSGGMALQIYTDYHLNGVNGNNAEINAESNIKTSATAVPITSGGAQVTYDDLKGLSKSTVLVDMRTGLVVEEKGKTHISGNLGVNAPGVSMQIPLDINSTSKIITFQ